MNGRTAGFGVVSTAADTLLGVGVDADDGVSPFRDRLDGGLFCFGNAPLVWVGVVLVHAADAALFAESSPVIDLVCHVTCASGSELCGDGFGVFGLNAVGDEQ